MQGLRAQVLFAFVLHALGSALGSSSLADLGSPGKHRQEALVQTWGKQLEGAGAQDTPVTRVTKLLKELMAELKADLAEDEKLHCELMTWCKDQKWTKGEETADAEGKITFLISEIERLTALVKQLTTEVAELKTKLEGLEMQLSTISSMRDTEAKAFHDHEPDLIAQVENLRAAIIVLNKHQVGKSTLPDVKTERDAWAFLDVGHRDGHRDLPGAWGAEHESDGDRSLDQWMLNQGMTGVDETPAAPRPADKFLQTVAKPDQQEHHVPILQQQMSASDQMAVLQAVDTARAYAKRKGLALNIHGYTPGYNSQSGEILGILKQMYESMKKDLEGMQGDEKAKQKTFIDLRGSLKDQITAAYLQLDRKEDDLATAKMDLANSKEELVRTQQVLDGLKKYMKALLEMCAEAEKNFQARKAARMEEMKAVSEAITILMDDDARDSFHSTYGDSGAATLLQVAANDSGSGKRRHKAAALLRGVAKRTGNPQFSALAASVDLDAFTKVKKAIDDMIEILKVQQADEVKKKDWCVEEVHTTEMKTLKKEDLLKDLQAKIEFLKLHIKKLLEEIESAKVEVSNLESSLQRANEDRQKANLDFQRTVADQRASIEVLTKALDKLASYYDGKGDSYTIALQTWKRKAGFLQTGVSLTQLGSVRQPSSSSSSSSSTSVTVERTSVDQSQFGSVSDIKGVDSISQGVKEDTGPVDLGQPVAIAAFKPNKGAGGVMQLIEKLIYDAKDLEATAIQSESEAQAEYEATVTDTNESVAALQKAIVTKTAEVGQSKKEKRAAERDVMDTIDELEDLSKYAADIHKECDFYTKNFDARQSARALEIEALQQAKQILSGAVLD